MSKPTAYRFENGLSLPVVNKTADYTLTPNDNGALIVLTNGSGKTITAPVNLPIGFRCRIVQGGAGAVTVAGDGTSTIRNPSSKFKTNGQYAVAELVSHVADSFCLTGDLTT